MAPGGLPRGHALPRLLASGCDAGQMSEQAKPAVQTRSKWKLPIPIGVNLLLGIPAIVPIFLAWYVLSNGPLADLGWTQREPTENDGMLPMLVIVVPVICAFGSLWLLANFWMRLRTAVPAFQYWLACAAASCVPFCSLVVKDL
jgi:hypothetical protein